MAVACDINDRFDILIFEEAADYIERKRAERRELRLRQLEYMRKIEYEGFCEGCRTSKKYLRWVRNCEVYICYDCFIHDLECEADVRVPMTRVDDMEEYMSRVMWEGLCEEEEGGYAASICKDDDNVLDMLVPIYEEEE